MCFRFATDLATLTGISVICRWPCPFFRICWGITKTAITALYSYASLWHIIVNIPKTKVIIFNERYTKVRESFHYGDNITEKAEQYKYLGVVYSTKSANNVLKETFSHLASQAGKAIFSLRKQSRPVVGKLSSTSTCVQGIWLSNIAHTSIGEWYMVHRRWC